MGGQRVNLFNCDSCCGGKCSIACEDYDRFQNVVRLLHELRNWEDTRGGDELLFDCYIRNTILLISFAALPTE